METSKNKKILLFCGGIAIASLIGYGLHRIFRKKGKQYGFAELTDNEVRIFEKKANDAKINLPSIKISYNKNLLSSETVQELYTIILNTFYPTALEITTYYRSERRKNFENMNNYAIAYVEFAGEIANALSPFHQEVLEFFQIDNVLWMESIEHYMKLGDQNVSKLVMGWMNFFEKQRVPRRVITLEEYKKALEAFCDAIEKDAENVNSIQHKLKPAILARVRLHRAWDYVYFQCGLEEEDLNGFKVENNEEIRFLRGKYLMALSSLQETIKKG